MSNVKGDRSIIPTKQGAAIIGGNHTDIVIQDFASKYFILLTQFKKIGTLIQITKDQALNEFGGSTGQVTQTTKVLLGKDDEETLAVACGIARVIPTDKTIILGLALKETKPSVLKPLQELVLKHIQS